MVGLALVEPLLDHLGIAIKTISLVEGSFISIQTQPGHAVEDGFDILRGRALSVGILDS